ncbi:(2Fe-2S)-binding protein [uncultured Abyssibacter sp.]|uniref:(2Fe-2S)-binding protein n=1 Tax=uncultured Abyssibacter sp. TaxID=2320202 RepID=UPI0032B11E3A|tara:strand:+ start:188 stop:385 length:198 start_codon:yes stop_codon:yes gene_type:complete
MIVCVCNRVSDRQIRERVQASPCALRDLRRELCVGTQCAKCLPTALDVMRESASEPNAVAISRVV